MFVAELQWHFEIIDLNFYHSLVLIYSCSPPAEISSQSFESAMSERLTTTDLAFAWVAPDQKNS